MAVNVSYYCRLVIGEEFSLNKWSGGGGGGKSVFFFFFFFYFSGGVGVVDYLM